MFLSVALKKPGESSCRWANVHDEKHDDEEWHYGDDINEWIARVVHKNRKNILCYNDEEPGESKATSKGHAKGVVVWDDKRIGWLIHSVPKYPQIKQENTFEPIEQPQLIYGQSFLYMEIDNSQPVLNTILDHLTMMEVHIYHQTDDGIKNVHISKKDKKNVILYHFTNDIFHIAKSSAWGKDLYEDYLSDYINAVVLCQTWAKPATPSTSKVKNVRTMKWDGDGDDDEYQTTQDHSKYAVSMDSQRPWVLFGDINHMESQTRRGGGGMLIRHPALWRMMNHHLINYTEVVPNPNQKAAKKWWECFGWKCLKS
jgi:deoxyribonuclease-2